MYNWHRKWDNNKSHTCALLPPIPNEFTLIRSARSVGHGVALTGTLNFSPLNGTTLLLPSEGSNDIGSDLRHTLGVRGGELDVWRNGLIFQGQHSLDQTCYT
jgi:hypothetical protein